MSGLVRYDAMCRAIDAAYKVDEVKDIRDKAKALEAYAQQAKNVEAERRACEIRLRAERKVGDLRRKEEKLAGRPKSTPTKGELSTNAERRRELGISKKQDEQWQALAAVPEKQFEAALAAPEKPTTNGIIAAHTKPKQKAMNPRALWVWGRLTDFERDGVLDTDARAMFAEMLPHMQKAVRRLGPRVAAWIKRCTDDE